MSETAALRRPFLIGLLAIAIVLLLVTGVLAVFSSVDDRPEGLAERWLTAAGDLTRNGVHDDAADRVKAHGDLALAEQLVGGVHADGKTIQIRPDGTGRSEVAAATGQPKPAAAGAPIVTVKDEAIHAADADGKNSRKVSPADPTLKVPSDGGDVASKAPLGLYAVALLIGVGIAVAASALVRAAGREHELRSAVT